MSFMSQNELEKVGFKFLGKNIKISRKASIYNPELITIDDNSRVDDFCVLSGCINIGKNVHIAVYCNVAGGDKGVSFNDFSGLAYGCHVFSQSDDYSGRTLTNPTVPDKYKNESKLAVTLGKHVIVGACSLVFPGVSIGEGTAIGANSIVTKSTDSWSIYFGNPAKKIKSRQKELLMLETQYLSESEELK